MTDETPVPPREPATSLGWDTLWETFSEPAIPVGRRRRRPRAEPLLPRADAPEPSRSRPAAEPVASVEPPVEIEPPSPARPEAAASGDHPHELFRSFSRKGHAPPPPASPLMPWWRDWELLVAVGGAVALPLLVLSLLPSPTPMTAREQEPGAPDARAAAGRPSMLLDAWGLPEEPLLGFVEIPDGLLQMGTDRAIEPWADLHETPLHDVHVPSFLIGRYEVTVAQLQACVDSGGCLAIRSSVLAGRAQDPVRGVSWTEAMEYCTWLDGVLHASSRTPPVIAARLEGRGDRRRGVVSLPSEAEWERAAGGDTVPLTGTTIHGGVANTMSAGLNTVAVVGSFRADRSPFGVFDLKGNVSEWTRSAYRGYPYDPLDGREDTLTPGRRVARGGSYLRGVWFSRPSARMDYAPDARLADLGFRVVITAAIDPPPAPSTEGP
jgi:formylglycine-generating enzyme required for sulfatase activity